MNSPSSTPLSGDYYKDIVAILNAPPFNRNFTLVSFDEVTGAQLLDLFNEILATLDPGYKVDLRNEQREIAVLRMMEFLKLLKFRATTMKEEDWKKGLMEGSKVCIYPPMHYVLTNYDLLKKRAYIGRFMQKIEIPSEFMTDASIQDVLQQQQDLQRQFVETHKKLEKILSSNQNPEELKSEIQSFSEEKKQLEAKIESMQIRARSTEGFEEILNATHNLRLEQEEEGMIADRMYQQKMALERSTTFRNEAEMRVSEMRSVRSSATTAQEMMKVLEGEVDRFKVQALRNLPEEIANAKKQLDDLKAKASVQRTTEQVNYMKQEYQNLQDEIQSMKTQIANTPEDPNLDTWKKQYKIQLRKLADQEKEIEEEEAERQRLESELQKYRSAYEYRKKVENYRQLLLRTTADFRGLKEELTGIQSETIILDRTAKILEQRDGRYEEFLSQLERKKGITGARDVKSNIEKVSAIKSDVDADKEKILTEMSKQIEQIQSQLADRRTKLEPSVNELKSYRQIYTQLEDEHKKRALSYRKAASAYESEKRSLEETCTQLQEDCLKEEGRYHTIQQSLVLIQNMIAKIGFEKQYIAKEAKITDEFPSYRDLYATTAQQREDIAKALRRKQKDIKENETQYLKQKTLFNNLLRLLQLKKESQEATKRDILNQPGEDYGHFNMDGADIMTIDQD